MKKIKNLIIGAGPAGLAVAGRMRKKNLEFVVLESTNNIADRWHHHYDRLLLHTVKQLSHLPHLEFPEDYPTYVPREKLVKYYENYAKHLEIKPDFNETVISIKLENEGWEVMTENGKQFIAENVIIATGINRIPNVPTFRNQEEFAGKIVHSIHYKNVAPFKNQKVLVVGMGNTGAELALDLSENNVNVTLAVRSPITLVPRDVNGRPVQLTAKTLAKIPFGIGDWLGTQIRKVIIGDLTKYGVPISKQHPVVLLRETGKTPVIDLGTVAQIKKGKIKIVGKIDRFFEKGVEFENGKKHEFDSIILATGYRAKVEEFLENGKEFLDKYEIPKQPIGEGKFKGVYFVGFDNYKLGGILGSIYNDSKTVVDDILGK
ncbi:MAG: flavin-containing monooxygenase [Saprospiraceae bacterium]